MLRMRGRASNSFRRAMRPQPRVWHMCRADVCKGTGWKPCGQCDGTGVNQDDLFGGKFLKGDTCWLCSGKAKTMCGNCIDLTDSF